MEYAPLILDALVILVLLYFAISRLRQGFAAALVRLLSVALSFVGAWVVSPLAADYTFRIFFRIPDY
jgi:uncharacterized membrane protein required for colicin V production